MNLFERLDAITALLSLEGEHDRADELLAYEIESLYEYVNDTVETRIKNREQRYTTHTDGENYWE